MAGVSGLATGAGACEEVRSGRPKVLEVVVDEVGRVTVFCDVDGSTEVVAAVIEVSSGPEGCDVSIEVVEMIGARADESVAAASDRVLDPVFGLAVKHEVAVLVKLVGRLLLT